MRTMFLLSLLAMALLGGCCSSGACANEPTAGPSDVGLRGGEADAHIRALMHDRFRAPERRVWVIEHVGAEQPPTGWRIAGTMWGVRELPEYTSSVLDNLDRDAAWEIDAVALAQNYGVIDMYWYLSGYPRKASSAR